MVQIQKQFKLLMFLRILEFREVKNFNPYFMEFFILSPEQIVFPTAHIFIIFTNTFSSSVVNISQLMNISVWTLLWSGAVVWSPLPPPGPGHWSCEDESVSCEDRWWQVAQLSHWENQTVWQGYSGWSGQWLHHTR